MTVQKYDVVDNKYILLDKEIAIIPRIKKHFVKSKKE